MRLFSVRKSNVNKRNIGKKVLIVTGVMLALFMSGPIIGGTSFGGITAYAAEQAQVPTSNWYQDIAGAWRVKDPSGNIIANAWFCDYDGSWSLLDATGARYDGLINYDNGHFYYFIQGKMQTINGIYNGVSVTYNQDPEVQTGEVLSGVQELINSGVTVTNVAAINNWVYASSFATNTQNQSQAQNEENIDKLAIYHGDKLKSDVDANSLSRAFTQEELARMKQSLDAVR